MLIVESYGDKDNPEREKTSSRMVFKQPFSATTDLNFENRSEHRIFNRVPPRNTSRNEHITESKTQNSNLLGRK